MDKRDIRSIAAKTFMDKFEEQLDVVLQETQIEENNSQPTNTDKQLKEPESDEKLNFSSELEEAIADIDEYIQTNKKHPPSSTSE